MLSKSIMKLLVLLSLVSVIFSFMPYNPNMFPGAFMTIQNGGPNQFDGAGGRYPLYSPDNRTFGQFRRQQAKPQQGFNGMPQGMPQQGFGGMPQGMPQQGFGGMGNPNFMQGMNPQAIGGMPPQGFNGMPQGMPQQGFNGMPQGMNPQGFGRMPQGRMTGPQFGFPPQMGSQMRVNPAAEAPKDKKEADKMKIVPVVQEIRSLKKELFDDEEFDMSKFRSKSVDEKEDVDRRGKISKIMLLEELVSFYLGDTVKKSRKAKRTASKPVGEKSEHHQTEHRSAEETQRLTESGPGVEEEQRKEDIKNKINEHRAAQGPAAEEPVTETRAKHQGPSNPSLSARKGAVTSRKSIRRD